MCATIVVLNTVHVAGKATSKDADQVLLGHGGRSVKSEGRVPRPSMPSYIGQTRGLN